MKLKMIVTLVFSLMVISGCKNGSDNCPKLSAVVEDISTDIQDYYSKIAEWDKYNARMTFLKGFTDLFHEEFSNIQLALESSNEVSFEKSKYLLADQIGMFLHWTTEIEVWINDDYFWIIDQIKTNIENFSLEEGNGGCAEINKLRMYQLEKELLSTFYLLGYSDQYCFNKVNPTLNSANFVGRDDTTSFSVGHFAYDSTVCSKVNIRIENGSNVILDSSDCNWIHVADRKLLGLNYFTGRIIFPLYGEEITHEFEIKEYFK